MKSELRFLTSFLSVYFLHLFIHPSPSPLRSRPLKTLARRFCTCNSHGDDPIHVPHGDTLSNIIKLASRLKNFDILDGRLFDFDKGTVTIDEYEAQGLREFKSLTRSYLCSSGLLQSHMKTSCFPPAGGGQSITLSSLTPVCAFMDFTVKQRKLIRVTACRQVTQPKIWTGALVEILRLLKHDLETFGKHFTAESVHMGLQIASLCLDFLDNTCAAQGSRSWMHLSPVKTAGVPHFRTWGDVLEVFSDLVEALRGEKKLHFYVRKLEAMKEGLYQVKNVVMGGGNEYREVVNHEGLVQKILSKALGHSSNCLFTLLMYYLYGCVRDVEVEVFGGLRHVGRNNYRFSVGRILASGEEKVVLSGVKQLYRVLGLMEFVWRSAGQKGQLELQGHLWCLGADRRLFTYRGSTFFVHDIGCPKKLQMTIQGAG